MAQELYGGRVPNGQIQLAPPGNCLSSHACPNEHDAIAPTGRRDRHKFDPWGEAIARTIRDDDNGGDAEIKRTAVRQIGYIDLCIGFREGR
jgi:hypothetical protein